MAAKGTEAKSAVERKIKEAFGDAWIGIIDKKIYVWADDGGEKVQIAISLTCPKNTVETVNLGNVNGHDFSDDHIIAVPSAAAPTEITEEEKKNIADLISILGL